MLSLDGPGQGEISTKLPIRHDYEVAVSAAIDAMESRDDIDAARVGLIGVSLGGYYACRAAAFEPGSPPPSPTAGHMILLPVG